MVASNSTLGISNSSEITFAGPMVSIVATANGTTGTHSTPVSTTVTVNATAMDSAGNVATGENGVVWFTVDDANIGSDTDGVASGSVAFVNGVATIPYTKTTAGTYTILAFYNESVSDTVDVTFTGLASLHVTAAPTSVTANTSTNVVFTVTSEGTAVSGTAVSGATVTLSGVFTNVSTTGADGKTTVAVNATSTGTITATVTKAGFTDGTATVAVLSDSGEWNTWDDDCEINDTEISLAEYDWATNTPINGHTITDAEISLLEYQWATGDVC